MGEEFVSDDEFHETFEDITSTSGSESADDEESGSHNNSKILRITRVAPDAEGSPVWTPSSFQSKFSIWKDDPSSINERRQRFFKQMGLRSSRDEPLDGSTLSGFGFAETGSKASRNVGEDEAGPAIELVSSQLYLLQLCVCVQLPCCYIMSDWPLKERSPNYE